MMKAYTCIARETFGVHWMPSHASLETDKAGRKLKSRGEYGQVPNLGCGDIK